MARKTKFFKAEAVPYWTLVVFLVLIFLTGGASRADVQSLIILRPAAVIFCGIALWSLTWEHVKTNRFLFGITAAMFALVLSHLVPLPPSVWGVLPERDLVEDIDKTAGLGAVFRPISLVPSASWNSLFSLFIPLGVLLLGIQLDWEQHCKILWLVLILGLLTGALGVAQLFSDPNGLLYLYSVTNNGAAVGLFANRNHQAVFLACLFPMLATLAFAPFISEVRAVVRNWVAALGSVALVPLLLVTGSRAGLIAGTIGLFGGLLIYSQAQRITPKRKKHKKNDWRLPAFVVGVCVLIGIMVAMSRAEALSRLTAPDAFDDVRFKIWRPTAEMAWKFFPFGSGVGTFKEVFQLFEPYDMLEPSYINHAHNDWLELYMTTGLPGLLLLAVAGCAYVRQVASLLTAPSGHGSHSTLAWAGVSILFIIALGSVADYPLRTPILEGVLVIGALWMSARPDQKNESISEGSLGQEHRQNAKRRIF
jgi:O-antigen ligase